MRATVGNDGGRGAVDKEESAGALDEPLWLHAQRAASGGQPQQPRPGTSPAPTSAQSRTICAVLPIEVLPLPLLLCARRRRHGERSWHWRRC